MKNYLTKTHSRNRAPGWKKRQVERAQEEKHILENRRRLLLGLPVLGYSDGSENSQMSTGMTTEDRPNPFLKPGMGPR